MIYMFLSNNPSSGDINSSNLSCYILFLLHFLMATVSTYLLQIILTTISTGTGPNRLDPLQLFSNHTCINFGLANFL